MGEASFEGRLRARLDRTGVPWPGAVECAAALPSTNDRLKEWARSGAGEWSVVVAEEQTSGRGRLGNEWASPRGNLFLSVLLRPLGATSLGLIPLAVGVGVCDALRTMGASPELKWPNDVLLEGRKVAGILAEATWGSGGLETVVIGVGVNVALDPHLLPAEASGTVTSLAAMLGRELPLEDVAAEVLEQLALWYHRLAEWGGVKIVDAWRSRSAPWWGRSVEVKVGERTVRGVARGIDETGALLVEDASGRVLAVVAGEARSLRLG